MANELPETSTVTVSGKTYSIKDANGREMLSTKQDKLTAGEGITIDENGVISATPQGITVVTEMPNADENSVGKLYQFKHNFFVGKSEKRAKIYAWYNEDEDEYRYTISSDAKKGDRVFILSYVVDGWNTDSSHGKSADTFYEIIYVGRINEVGNDSITFNGTTYTKKGQYSIPRCDKRLAYKSEESETIYILEDNLVLEGMAYTNDETSSIGSITENSITLDYHCYSLEYFRDSDDDFELETFTNYYFENLGLFYIGLVKDRNDNDKLKIATNLPNNTLKRGIYEFYGSNLRFLNSEFCTPEYPHIINEYGLLYAYGTGNSSYFDSGHFVVEIFCDVKFESVLDDYFGYSNFEKDDYYGEEIGFYKPITKAEMQYKTRNY